jgi:hypothetical protein
MDGKLLSPQKGTTITRKIFVLLVLFCGNLPRCMALRPWRLGGSKSKPKSAKISP